MPNISTLTLSTSKKRIPRFLKKSFMGFVGVRCDRQPAVKSLHSFPAQKSVPLSTAPIVKTVRRGCSTP